MPEINYIEALLGLGSNLGDRLAFIKLALKKLEGILNINSISSLYESRSLKKDSQKNYYNVVIEVETSYTPEELLKSIKDIELLVGRRERGNWEEREIDIDIIDYNNSIYKSNNLTIPHYDMQNRSFVLYPLLEINSNYIHPIFKKNVGEMLKDLTDELNIKKIGGI
jgi:2-amino-4-hydroxy-6-hydroxymethyldihydropteridine diphosphokinase